MKILPNMRHSIASLWPTATVITLLVSACAGVAPAAPVSPTVTVAPAAATSPAATALSTPQSMPAAPGAKAYIGLFKDNAVAVVDTGTNQKLATIPVPAGPHGLVITPDGRVVYVSSDGDSKVSVIDTSADKVVDTIEVGKTPHGLAITPDGHWVLVAGFGTSRVTFIDTSSNKIASQVPISNPHNIAISPDGGTAYVASQAPGAAGLAIINIASQTKTGMVQLDKVPRALNYSPDGKMIYFTLAGVDAVQVLDPLSNKVMAQIPVGASPHHPLFTPNGRYGLVVSQGPGQLAILNPTTNKVLQTVTVGKMPHWIATNAKGTTAWVTNEASNDLSVVDLDTGKVTATIPVGNAPRKIVVQPQPSATAQVDVKTVIQGFAFVPTLTVKAGQPIVWINNDEVPHTVTSDTGLWESGDIQPGTAYTLTLDQPGTYPYHCMHHPYMQGVIKVTA
ncbi:MAG TPA: cytochrome D1 domain-containing protein [Anaerolineae bacterium]